MNIRQLEMFCLVVEKQSCSEAARLLYLSQPSISFQLQSLENELGFELLQRTKQGTFATPQGQIYYRYARQMVNLYNEALSDLRNAASNPEGSIILGASTNAGRYMLPRLIGCLRRHNPDLHVNYKVANSSQVGEWLQKDMVDLAVLEHFDHNPHDFALAPFIEDEMVLVTDLSFSTPHEGRFDFGDLDQVDLVLREKGSGTRQALEDALLGHGTLTDRIVTGLEVPDTEAIKEIVQSGAGVSLLPRWSVKREVKLGLLKEFHFAAAPLLYTTWLVIRKENLAKPLISYLRTFILSRRVDDLMIRCGHSAPASSVAVS